MKLGNMKKVLAVVMAAAMTVGSVSAAPSMEVMAEQGTPAISAQVAKDKKGMKVTWNKLEDATVTGYRVYRTELNADGSASGSAQAISTLDKNGVSVKSWKFDFGPNKVVTGDDGTGVSCLAEGYTSVNEDNAYYTQAQGYGFTEGIPTVEGGTLAFINRTDGKNLTEDVLNGDFAIVQAPTEGTLTSTGKLEGNESYMEFVVDLPNGDYKVAATHSPYYNGRTISQFWFQGEDAGRWPGTKEPEVCEKTVKVENGKLKISASAGASSKVPYPPTLSALTITEVKEITTGVDADGSFYCNDVTADPVKNYTYKVVAMKGNTEAADLTSGDVKPVVAPTVYVEGTTKTGATLSINNNEVVADSYNIYRKKASDTSFGVPVTLTDLSKYVPEKIINDKQVYVNDNFSTYTLGNKDNTKNLLTSENGGWTVANNANEWYSGMVMDKSDNACISGIDFLNASALTNYDGAFMLLAMGASTGATFHKKLADAAVLDEPTRLKLNFALPNFFAKNDRGVVNTCLYLADKEIAVNDTENGYIAKLEYNADDNKIYLNDTEVYAFTAATDAVRSKWNTITLDIDPQAKKISYEFEREEGTVVKNGKVSIPDAAQEPSAQEGEGDADEKSYATLSFTSGVNAQKQPWGTIAIDNLKFASTEAVDGPSRVYTYTDNSLDANTEYNYYVGAVVNGKEVVKSSTVTAKTQPILVGSISLNPSTPVEIKKDDTADLPEVIVSPDNASDKSYEWSSDNEDVAKIENGKIKGVSAGTANIIATANDGSGKTASCAVTVTAVSLNRTRLSLKIGDGAKLTATVAPNFITNQNVTWKSDNNNIATVDQEGNVKAIAAGNTKITVTAANNGETATCTVSVSKAAVKGITLNATSGTLKKGATVTLTATVAPDNATNKNITWSTSNPGVATVTNGVVKAVGRGTAVITAASADNASITATYKVTVTEDPARIPATAVKVKSTKITLDLSVKSKKTAKISASLTPSNSTDSITYSVPKNCKVIKVDKSGKITALKTGSAKVTVKSTSGKTKTVNVTVKASATKVAIKGKGIKKGKITLKKGKKLNLTATVSPKNCTDKAKWSTSKKKYVTIKTTKKGATITAKKKGKSVITVKAGKKSAKITVTVK